MRRPHDLLGSLGDQGGGKAFPSAPVVIFALFVAGATLIAAPAPAAEDSPTRTEKADTVRRAQEGKAERRVGYPNVQDLVISRPPDTIDFYALSQQIARLGAYLQMLAQPLAPPAPPGLAVPGAPDAESGGIYGPHGPTAKSVRLILEYRLLVAGNPRLRVGDVREAADVVIAQVVTADGALVEEYAVDKKSGAWTPIR